VQELEEIARLFYPNGAHIRTKVGVKDKDDDNKYVDLGYADAVLTPKGKVRTHGSVFDNIAQWRKGSAKDERCLAVLGRLIKDGDKSAAGYARSTTINGRSLVLVRKDLAKALA